MHCMVCVLKIFDDIFFIVALYDKYQTCAVSSGTTIIILRHDFVLGVAYLFFSLMDM
ncbi:hypothetical protein PILCRDRAFT_455293 [Piloderma croceum F 1598]|uniref:Uncharacterized protein n=1 Tax=Piloderma croceum (strain F 1598) TaxID=765440 RepID=A0A0C3FW26_PILCF|nr:hypothetical protein PILCRDRAFT_455293 [Piloderma croceum F 1598]